MEVGSGEASSSSGQLEDWAAGVAADLNEDRPEDRRRSVDRASASPERQRNGDNKYTLSQKRTRSQQEPQSSAEDDNGTKEAPNNGQRPKLPRPSSPQACPRCNSMDTKFCYYNNYNVKQPRFYCKACQRYWTAGGTLRNIAPGSGRRKSKGKPASHELRDSPSLADHLTAAAHFGLPVSSLNPALLAASNPAGLLGNGTAATAGFPHPQLLGAHSSIADLRLHGSQWAGGIGLGPDLSGGLALREHLHAQLGAAGGGGGAAATSALPLQPTLDSLDARLLLAGHHSNSSLDAAPPASLVQPLRQQAQAHLQRGDLTRPLSRSVSPPPITQQQQQQRQLSSPQQPNSQSSQQPSPPQLQRNDSVSNAPDADGAEVCLQVRRVRLKLETTEGGACSGFEPGKASLGLGTLKNGASGSSQNIAQMASLNLPPSMASLTAVMGPGGGNSSGLGGGLHHLLGQQQQQDGGSRSSLDAVTAGHLARHQLQLALQQQQQSAAQQQQQQQQHESLYQLNALLPQNAVATAALHAQHPLWHGLGQQTGAMTAALDSMHCSALLHQAAGLGGVGGWLQGGAAALPGMLPSPAVVAAAALQAQSLGSSGASSLMQQQQLSGNSGAGSAAGWLTLAAAAAAGNSNKVQLHGSAQQSTSSAAAIAAANAAGGFSGAGVGGHMAAHHMLYAQTAAAAANEGCNVLGAGGWAGGGAGMGAFSTGVGTGSSWSLWPSYGNQTSNSYAGYALQAAAAAYSNGR